MKQGFDLLRMVSNVIESAEERVTKILRSFKEAIVRDILTRVVPDSFGRIQFRPVRWKLEDFQIATVRFEPGIGFLFFMIRSIILNQIDPVAASVEGGHDHLIYLIQDNASYHKKQETYAWFKANRRYLEVFQLPPYWPELNATERIWNYTRKYVTHNRFFERPQDLCDALFRRFDYVRHHPQEIEALLHPFF